MEIIGIILGLLLAISPFVLLIIIFNFFRNTKKCPHCKSKEISFTGESIEHRIRHARKDGKADQRYKNNEYNYTVHHFECKQCNVKFTGYHFTAKTMLKIF